LENKISNLKKFMGENIHVRLGADTNFSSFTIPVYIRKRITIFFEDIPFFSCKIKSPFWSHKELSVQVFIKNHLTIAETIFYFTK